MKIVLYDDYKVGLLKDGNVVDVSAVVPRGGTPQLTIEGLITNFQSLKGALERALNQGEAFPSPRCNCGRRCRGLARSSAWVGILGSSSGAKAPCGASQVARGRPGSRRHRGVTARGRQHLPSRGRAGGGHRPHGLAGEQGRRPQERLWLYVRLRRLGPLPPESRQQFGKSFDTFAPIGPCIATWDEVPDPHQLQVRMWVDGQLRHDYPMSDIAHSIEESLAWMSSMVTLKPGDLFFLGTNHQGIGPLQDGEHAVIDIDRIGRLEFNVRSAAALAQRDR